MRGFLIVGFMVVLAGCVTATPGADRVKISSSQDAVQGCTFISQISETSGGLPANIVQQDVTTKLRNRAVALGATNIVSAGPQLSMPGPLATQNGDLYRCG